LNLFTKTRDNLSQL